MTIAPPYLLPSTLETDAVPTITAQQLDAVWAKHSQALHSTNSRGESVAEMLGVTE